MPRIGSRLRAWIMPGALVTPPRSSSISRPRAIICSTLRRTVSRGSPLVSAIALREIGTTHSRGSTCVPVNPSGMARSRISFWMFAVAIVA